MRILFHSGEPERTERITAKLEAIGFGFLLPVFFTRPASATTSRR